MLLIPQESKHLVHFLWFYIYLNSLFSYVFNYSFDRHALELLERMLTLDPAQVLFFHLWV